MSYIPERCDVIWISLNPRKGREQSGLRPAVVLSPGKYNEKVGLLICCPVTSQVKEYPFEVKIPDGLPVSGVILADQVKSLDWRKRHAAFICRLPQKIIHAAINKLGVLLQEY
ncbi:endoribonuclease MazF [Candidatus Sumerlaeota bacterium]|nr:endoribonuclease MazF [Candidatus Sumerlaeota bacterium]